MRRPWIPRRPEGGVSPDLRYAWRPQSLPRASCTATGNPRAISHGRHVAAGPEPRGFRTVDNDPGARLITRSGRAKPAPLAGRRLYFGPHSTWPAAARPTPSSTHTQLNPRPAQPTPSSTHTQLNPHPTRPTPDSTHTQLNPHPTRPTPGSTHAQLNPHPAQPTPSSTHTRLDRCPARPTPGSTRAQLNRYPARPTPSSTHARLDRHPAQPTPSSTHVRLDRLPAPRRTSDSAESGLGRQPAWLTVGLWLTFGVGRRPAG